MEKPTTQLSKHVSVDGQTLLLSINHHNSKRQCVEYCVEKIPYSLWGSMTFQILIICTLVLAVCINFNNIIGSSIAIVITIYSALQLIWQTKKEALLVVSSLGIQFTSTFRTGQQTSCFIPMHQIYQVLIIEAISLHRVLYNLVVVLEQPSQDKIETSKRTVIPLFQNTRPRLACLESIYTSLIDVLPSVQSANDIQRETEL